MLSSITGKLPSTLIELPGKVFLRGQTLKGRAHIVSEDGPYTAREIRVLIETKTNSFEQGSPFPKTEITLYFEENVEVTSTERIIDFEFPIPLTAPFSFDSGLVRTKWRIILFIDSGILPKRASQEIVVVPHFLKSETPPPVDEIPVPTCKKYTALAIRHRAFHLWRYMGFLHRSSNIVLDTDAEECTIGDPIRGTVALLKGFGSGMLSLYLVFFNKWRHGDTSEEEHLMLQTKGVFSQGSAIPFSCSLPLTGCPTFESKDAEMWWILRAVVSNPLRLNKVVEKEIFVRSITF
ncbi:MAG: hypothetical protein WBA22_15195 [Candidatus Methanofastidiosia archaeon]